MSNRSQERQAVQTGSPAAPTNVNILQWGGVAVAAATTLVDAMTNAVSVPLIGSRMMGFNTTDGWNRVRIGTVAAALFDLKVGGNEIGTTSYLGSQLLPGAGAFFDPGIFTIVSGVGELTFYVSYTRGAAGGFPILRVIFRDTSTGTEGQDVVLNSTVVITQPQGRQQLLLQELEFPHPADANPVVATIGIRVPRGVTACRMLVAEAGVVGTPGTINFIRITGGTLR